MMPLGVASEKLGRGQVTWVDRCQTTRAFVDAARELGFPAPPASVSPYSTSGLREVGS